MSESALNEVLLRLATDREFAASLGDDPAALADRHGLTAAEAATVLATRIDTGARSPGRLEERLSRSGLVFGADAMPAVDVPDLDLPPVEPAPQPQGDFSADTFEPAQHFSVVSAEQGPVQLDGDGQPASLLPARPEAPEQPPEPAPPAPDEPPADTAEPAPDLHDALRGREPVAQEPVPETETAESESDSREWLRGREFAEPQTPEQPPNATVVSSETTQTENGTETRVKYADGSEDITTRNQDGRTATHSVPSPGGSLSITTEPDGDTHYEVRVGGNGHVFADGDPGVQTVTNADGSTVTTINTLDRTRHVISVDAGGATTYDDMVRDNPYWSPDHAVTYTKVTIYPDGHTETSTVTPAKPDNVTYSSTYSSTYEPGENPLVEEILVRYSDGTEDLTVREYGAGASGHIMEPFDEVKVSHTVPGPYGDSLTVTIDGPPDQHPPTVYTVEGHSFHSGDAGLRVTLNDNGTENVYITLPDGSRHSVVVDESGQSTYIRELPNDDDSFTHATRFPDGHIETKTIPPEGDQR